MGFSVGFFFAAMNSVGYRELILAQFPGRVLLYPDEIAGLLGKTADAMARLIERGNLPFAVKKLAGRRCVGLLDLVAWLESGAELVASEVPPDPIPEPKRPRTRRKTPPPKTAATAAAVEIKAKKVYAPVAGGGQYSLAKKLAEMRALGWARVEDSGTDAIALVAEALKCELMKSLPVSRGPEGDVEYWDFYDEGVCLTPIRKVYRLIHRSALIAVAQDIQANVAIQGAFEPISVVRAVYDGAVVYEAARFGETWFTFLQPTELEGAAQ